MSNQLKIFITGGGGMLATELESFYARKGANVIAPTHQQLDITDWAVTSKAIADSHPHYVFHTAAMHVDACEDDPESAFKANAWATANLGRACTKLGARFIYISSCGFFGDEIRYYSEYEPVVLKTVYAHSKYQGEVLALKECSMTFAIRPGWLFGGSIKHKKNFVYQRYLEALKEPVIGSAGDKHGTPTYTADLVNKIDEILETDQPGLYHVTNGGGCTRAEYVRKIVESCGLETKVEPVDSSRFPRKANVPDCELLDNWNLKYLGLSVLLPWEEAIERFVRLMMQEIGVKK